MFGALCALVYGRPRLTADVDVTVELRGTDVRALLAALQESGFELRMELEEAFLQTTRLLPLVHRPTAIPLDILLATTALQEELLDRARVLDVGGVRVPLMSPEDLVVSKIVAGRRKDLEDVRGVLREQTTLDLARVRMLLARFEQALGHTRLSGRLARLLRDSRP